MAAPLAARAFVPLPAPTGAAPYRLSSTTLGLPAAATRVLHVVGDSGGVQDPNPQMHVAAAMIADLAEHGVELLYHLGDVIYFYGDETEYGVQFYEPYAHYLAPIVAIPGNHDGENSDDPSVPSLHAFVENFCSTSPHLDPQAHETNRDTMDQPNVCWTLVDELVTIVGLYTNVPEGGVLAPTRSTGSSASCARRRPAPRSSSARTTRPTHATRATTGRRRWARCSTARSPPPDARPT